MRRRRWGETGLCVLVILAVLGIFSSNAAAELTASFHGFLESNFVLRDANGIQYGFLDHAFGVQQRNTLKFDVDVDPHLEWGPFTVEKVHLTYRGAYDSIFDLAAHRYEIRENIGATRFDYGLKDIRFENDLREAFIDFAVKSDFGRGFFRPGRQIVSWGEGMLETMNDIINPPDQSFNLFFQAPDDVKIPLWMGRLNYSLPRFSNIGLNFDLLWVPDIRPSQLGPRDTIAGNHTAGLQAPYVRILPGFTQLRDFGMQIREKVPTNENEYGGKITAEIGDRLSVSALYFRDVVNDPGMIIDLARNTAMFTHNKQHVYGGYFSYQLLLGGFEAIVRGEVSHYTQHPVILANPIVNFSTLTAQTFLYKPVTKTMLAIDKDMRIRWISPHDVTKVSVEWLHKTVNEWDHRLGEPWTYNDPNGVSKTQSRRNAREQDVISLQVMTFWWASKLSPMFFAAYSPGKHGDGGLGMLHPTIKWYITPQLYTNLGLQAFLGDTTSSYDFAGLIPTSEVTISMGYEW